MERIYKNWLWFKELKMNLAEVNHTFFPATTPCNVPFWSTENSTATCPGCWMKPSNLDSWPYHLTRKIFIFQDIHRTTKIYQPEKKLLGQNILFQSQLNIDRSVSGTSTPLQKWKESYHHKEQLHGWILEMVPSLCAWISMSIGNRMQSQTSAFLISLISLLLEVQLNLILETIWIRHPFCCSTGFHLFTYLCYEKSIFHLKDQKTNSYKSQTTHV